MPVTKYYPSSVSSTRGIYEPSGEQSAVMPNGTLGPNAYTTGPLYFQMATTPTATTSSVETDWTTIAQTARQSTFFQHGWYRLASQTIPAGTWGVAIATSEANNASNAFLALSIYVWRPSTSTVVGYVYDATTQLGTEWATTTGARVVSVSGNSVTAQDGDVLIVEFWGTNAQGNATSYQNRAFFNAVNGSGDFTTNGQTNLNSWIEAPDTLIPYTGRVYYTTSSLANSTSTDTVNYTTKASITFTPISGKSYAIFWSATAITNSTTGQSIRVRLQDTTNTVTYQQFLQTPELATSVENFSFADVAAFTAANSSSITFAVQFSPSAGTMTIRDTYMTVLELFDDEQFSTTAGDSANITTATPTTLNSVTVGAGDWYVIASAGAKSNDASATGQGLTDYQFEINDGTTNVVQKFGMFANNISDYEPVLLSSGLVSPTATTTYTFQAAENGNNTLNLRYRTIVALKKSNFRETFDDISFADSTNATTTAQTKLSVTDTPIAAVDYLVLGIWNAGVTANRVNSNFTQGGTSQFTAVPSRDPNDPDGRFSHGIFYTKPQTTTSTTWAITYNINATTATATINEASIIVLNLGSSVPQVTAKGYSFGYILV